MRLVEVMRRLTDDERREIVTFVDDVAAVIGRRPLSDHLWLDLLAGDTDGLLATRVADTTGTLAYGQISATNESAALEVVLRPGLDDGTRIRDDVVETAVDAFRATGGSTLTWWVDGPDDSAAQLAATVGLEPARTLLEMRRPLPNDDHATVDTRPFRVGADEAAWLDVNNRAFAEHAEQGGWSAETLALRLADPSFDPTGFRLHERDGRLAAFCWTKLHTDVDPVVGEIYIIAVDPDLHGLGLGKQLTLAGLDSIAARGVTVANLYVDAANSVAVGMYEQLGFTVHRTRQAFTGTFDD
ncbi:MAG: mycothiol synthase [Ilumatobacter sp.]|uniref:mycothiol synthase n=1 Tax=Ilumatobacter sp. TaxID=1967498 RepID=UPI00262DEBDE|nr:mycothiol synthase [Ilumatobacter sp.]MDJ0770401.1 mycothiol synthase [Ilumatobacter sp.]